MSAVMGFAVWDADINEGWVDPRRSPTIFCPVCFIEEYKSVVCEVMNEPTTDLLTGGGEQPVRCSVCEREVN